MKILLDNNIIIDWLAQRPEFYEDALKIVQLAYDRKAIECVTASSMTDMYFVLKKEAKQGVDIQDALKQMLTLITVLPVTAQDINNALELNWSDFEDAVQYSVAVSNEVDFIISRDSRFTNKPDLDIPLMDPVSFLDYLETTTI